MGSVILDFILAVSGDTPVLIVPLFHEAADGTLDRLRKVAINKAGVFSGETLPPGKAEVVAYEDGRAGDYSCGETRVVRVSEAEDKAVVAAQSFTAANLRQTDRSCGAGRNAKEQSGKNNPANLTRRTI
jgi:hypothetical protein